MSVFLRTVNIDYGMIKSNAAVIIYVRIVSVHFNIFNRINIFADIQNKPNVLDGIFVINTALSLRSKDLHKVSMLTANCSAYLSKGLFFIHPPLTNSIAENRI